MSAEAADIGLCLRLADGLESAPNIHGGTGHDEARQRLTCPLTPSSGAWHRRELHKHVSRWTSFTAGVLDGSPRHPHIQLTGLFSSCWGSRALTRWLACSGVGSGRDHVQTRSHPIDCAKPSLGVVSPYVGRPTRGWVQNVQAHHEAQCCHELSPSGCLLPANPSASRLTSYTSKHKEHKKPS